MAQETFTRLASLQTVDAVCLFQSRSADWSGAAMQAGVLPPQQLAWASHRRQIGVEPRWLPAVPLSIMTPPSAFVATRPWKVTLKRSLSNTATVTMSTASVSGPRRGRDSTHAVSPLPTRRTARGRKARGCRPEDYRPPRRPCGARGRDRPLRPRTSSSWPATSSCSRRRSLSCARTASTPRLPSACCVAA